MKRIYGTTVPYPTIPPYPTEEEIVAKAQKLIEFLSAPRPDLDNKQLTIIDVEKEKDTQIIPEEKLNIESTDIPNVVKKTKKNRDVAVKEKQKTTPSSTSVEELDNDEKSSFIEKIKTVWR
jgi:formaldehyde-activating enzyme involved in methanogenesis